MKKIYKLLTASLFAMIIFSVAGITPVLAIGGIKLVADKVVKKTTLINVAYTSVDVSGLAAYAGDYEQQLFSTLVNSLDIANDIRVLPNIKNKRNLTKLTAVAGAKPFSKAEEYNGSLSYTPRVLEVNPGKVELLVDLEDYRETWMADQMNTIGANANAQSIPFAPYVWGEVMKSLAAEINDRTAYFGFDSSATAAYDNADHPYSAGDRIAFTEASGVINYYEATATTASTESPATTPAKWKIVNAEAISKGFKELIADEITATNITPVATGAVTTGAEALTAQRLLFRSLPEAYKKMGVVLYQSYDDYELLMDGIEDKISKYTKADNTPVYLPGTDNKCIVKPVTWMSGSRRLIATPKENLLLGTDLLNNMNEIKVLENAKLWSMPVGIKFVLGFQIRDLDAIAVGDQA